LEEYDISDNDSLYLIVIKKKNFWTSESSEGDEEDEGR